MPAVGRLLTSRAYWLTLVLFSGSMLAVALYYQYALGEEPCQACIQVRLWVAGLLTLGLLMACLPPKAPLFAAANLLAAVFAVVWRSAPGFCTSWRTARATAAANSSSACRTGLQWIAGSRLCLKCETSALLLQRCYSV